MRRPRPRTALNRWLGIASAMLVVTPVAIADSSFTATSGRPFAANSVWNSAIPPRPAVMHDSAGLVAQLNSGQHTADLNDYAIPIYDASATSPDVAVSCTEGWGACPLPSRIRLPGGAVPNVGSDHAMVVIDWSTVPSTSYEFWDAADPSDNTIRTAWGGTAPNVQNGSGTAYDAGTTGSATATNVSRLAGVIRLREMQAGSIPHALVIATSAACSDYHRYPAAKTDGPYTGADCIPEGARIQLDPSADITSLPPGQQIIARALQMYGAYVIDTSSAPFAMAFEADPTLIGRHGHVPAAYSAAGLSWDYYDMSSIPWQHLQVLQQWDGAPDTAAPTTPTALTATDVADNSVTLAWTPSADGQGSGVAGYYLWRSLDGSSWTAVGGTTATTLTDTTARRGLTYHYSVQAVDGVGNYSMSSPSTRVSVR